MTSVIAVKARYHALPNGEIQRRVKQLACELVMGAIASGQIPRTEEAIRTAMPSAFNDAMDVIQAAQEYVYG